MKKIFAMLLVLSMVLGLCACGKSAAPAATEAPKAETEAPAAAMPSNTFTAFFMLLTLPSSYAPETPWKT